MNKKELEEATREVVRAFTVAGKNPRVHRVWKERLRKENPTMYKALVKLTDVVK